jgi:hypothetical protein
VLCRNETVQIADKNIYIYIRGASSTPLNAVPRFADGSRMEGFRLDELECVQPVYVA